MVADPDAFIFGLTPFGIVDDVAAALPELTEAIRLAATADRT